MSDDRPQTGSDPAPPAPPPAPDPPDPSDPSASRRKRIFAGRINAYPPYRSKLDDTLRDEDREEYEVLLVRNTPTRLLWEWLLARGYDLGKECVRRHREKFLRGIGELRRGADLAAQYARLGRAAGLTLPEATIGGLSQLLMQFFTREQLAEQLSAKDVQAVAAAVASFVETHQQVERVRRELAAAAGAAKGADPGAVVQRVRAILGV